MSQDDTEDRLRKMFEAKRTGLQSAIDRCRSMIGQPVESTVVPPMVYAILTNVLDLYNVQEKTIELVIALGKDINRIATETTRLGETSVDVSNIQAKINDLQTQFDSTLGPLDAVLDKIREREKEDVDIPGIG